MSTGYERVVQKARAAFATGRTKPSHFRKEQLKALLRMLDDKAEAFLEALASDLRKPRLEAVLCELESLKNETRSALYKVDEWMHPETPNKGIANLLDGVHIRNDPYGVVLIMGSWNYPVLLLLKPLVGAIAAGNCAILKPSEVAPAVSKVMNEMIPQYLDAECYHVVCGGIVETTELLKQRFDYIFYTGSTSVGKIVRKAANEFLTPVTLEMGGKSPTYVDNTVDYDVVAKRIMWGKVTNAGQTCIAPDYILCDKEVEDKLVKACIKASNKFLGDDPKLSKNYCRIISDRQYERLSGLLGDGDVAMGGGCDPNDRYIEPTILTNVKPNDAVMQDEIFGPILPIVNVQSCDEAISFVNAREKPLAMYVFSNKKSTVDKIVESTSSGTVCVNDVVMQFVCENTPFGGVGHSGLGAYGGKYTFDTFSHKKTCLYKDLGAVGEYLAAGRYPPYSEKQIGMLVGLLKKRNLPSFGWMKNAIIFLLGVAITIGCYRLPNSL